MQNPKIQKLMEEASNITAWFSLHPYIANPYQPGANKNNADRVKAHMRRAQIWRLLEQVKA